MLEFESLDAFRNYIKGKKNIKNIAIQQLDLTSLEAEISQLEIEKCLFLGCKLPTSMICDLEPNNYLFPRLNVPFNIYPNKLYNRHSLYKGYDRNDPDTYKMTLDYIIYGHFIAQGKNVVDIHETLARSLHDHSMSDGIADFLEAYEDNRIIAMMGGHGLSRNTLSYRQIVEISRRLTQEGYLMVSGGGPGAMEATHVGAWFAGQSDGALQQALDILATAPTYDHPNWLSTAFEVIEANPNPRYESLGIPTWLYGHEPPTPFATQIAKYFTNSIREEGLLAIAKGGIVFAPGSAGTMQEIFQEIAQNHYETFGAASPMIFLNKEYWSYDRPLYPAIELMTMRKNLNNLDIGLYDTVEEVLNHLRERYARISETELI